MNKNKIELSVIVPVYNEKESVKRLFSEIVESLKKIKLAAEIIFVDDGSTDGTDKILAKLKPITVISHRKNCGQSTAIETGIQHSRGEIIITLDGDGQNDPADFSLLLNKLNEGYDAICGWRAKRHDTESKKFISRGAKLLRSILIQDGVHDAGCTLRAYRRYCFDEVHLYGELHRMIPAMLNMRGFRITEIKINHRQRLKGKTKYNLGRVSNGLLDMVQVWINQKYGKRPLYLFGSCGLILMMTSGILLLLMAVMRMFFDYHLSDKIWPLMGVFGFISGLQFLIFGIIADLIISNSEHWLETPIRSIKIYE